MNNVDLNSDSIKTPMSVGKKISLVIVGLVLIGIAIFVVQIVIEYNKIQGVQTDVQQLAVKSNFSQIRVAAEMYKYQQVDESYLGLCADASISELLNRTSADAVCTATTGTYVISAPLSAQEFYCIDNQTTGKVITTNINSQSLSCDTQ